MSQSAWKIHNVIFKKKFSLSFGALRRTRYKREGRAGRNDVIVACQRRSIAYDLSPFSLRPSSLTGSR